MNSEEWFCKLICKRYITIKKIGSGSFCNVWMSYDLDTNKYVALKIYYSDEYKNGEYESEIFKNIKNSKFLILIDSCVHKDKDDSAKYYINVFELMMCSTQSLLKMDTFSIFGLPFSYTMNIFKQVVDSIYVLHSNGYLHGDIKPENVLICGISQECKDIIKKLNLNEFVKKKKRSGIVNQIIDHIKSKIDYIPTSSDDEYDDSNSDSDNNSSVSLSNIYEDDKISLFDEDELFCNNINDNNINDNDNNDNDNNINDNNINENNNKLKSEQIKKDFTYIYDNCMNIKISDFGSVLNIKNINIKKKHIQTSYYKPPEVILKIYLNEKIDIWALGCLLYEYLTGEILFDPDDYEKIHFIRYHLFLIMQTVGLIPNEIINKCTNRDIIFYNNSQFVKGRYVFDTKNILSVKLLTKFKNKNLNLSEDTFGHLLDIMLKMLDCNFNSRIGIQDVINHPIFKCAELK